MGSMWLVGPMAGPVMAALVLCPGDVDDGRLGGCRCRCRYRWADA